MGATSKISMVKKGCEIKSGGQEWLCDDRLMAKILITTIQVNL